MLKAFSGDWVSLHTAEPMAGDTEVKGEGYKRSAVSFVASGRRLIENAGDVRFGTAGSEWGLISHFAIWTAPVGGVMRFSAGLPISRRVSTGDMLTFAAGFMYLRRFPVARLRFKRPR